MSTMNVADLFGALEEIAATDTTVIDGEMEAFRENLRRYHQAQEMERRAKEVKEEVKLACVDFMRKHKQSNYDDAELGIKALCFERMLTKLNEHRLDAALAFCGLTRFDVSTFADWDRIWNSLPTAGRRRILDVLEEMGIKITEQDMVVSEDLVKRMLGSEAAREVYDRIGTGIFEFRVTSIKKSPL